MAGAAILKISQCSRSMAGWFSGSARCRWSINASVVISTKSSLLLTIIGSTMLSIKKRTSDEAVRCVRSEGLARNLRMQVDSKNPVRVALFYWSWHPFGRSRTGPKLYVSQILRNCAHYPTRSIINPTAVLECGALQRYVSFDSKVLDSNGSNSYFGN